MTRQDIAVVAIVALATAAVALGIEFTGRLVADESPQPEIRWPVLKHGAVEITLRAPNADLAPGGSPVAELEAVNSDSASDTVTVTLSLMSQSLVPVAAPLSAQTSPNNWAVSRTGPVARKVWQKDVQIKLDPGERKTLTFAPGPKAEIWKQDVDISLDAGEGKILSFTAGAKVQAGTIFYFTLAEGKNAVSTPPQTVKGPDMKGQPPASGGIPVSQSQPGK